MQAQTRLTQDEALRLAFPAPAEIERRTAYLDETQLAEASELAGSEVKAAVVTYYVARSGKTPLGVAWFDAHRVRTHPEVLMIVVNPAGEVDRIELLRFAEPPKYAAPAGWLARFTGRRLRADLDAKNAVAGMTGATLTSRAVTAAVRRALALQQTIRPLEGEIGVGDVGGDVGGAGGTG